MIYIMCGIQGSGKSTFAKELNRKYGWEIISTDGVRKAYPDLEEKYVFPYTYDLCAQAIRENRDAIFDATNITPFVRSRLKREVEKLGVECKIGVYYLLTDVKVCHDRVVKRNRDINELYLPPEVVYQYNERFIEPTMSEGFEFIKYVVNGEVVDEVNKLVNLKNDYCGIMLPEIMEKLNKEMNNSFVGYGCDFHTEHACDLIKKEIGDRKASVNLLVGGTSANKIMIAHALKPHEAVICCDTGHINVHETGAIEETGHKVLTGKNKLGKLTVSEIKRVINAHSDIHMVKPKMVYISNTTEYGTVYTKEELSSLSEYCKKNNLYFYIDGARLGSALTSEECDYDLKFVASICDAFYIGGTKNGAPLGEALVIMNDELKEDIGYSIKHYGGLLAKGFINGICFETLFEEGLYYSVGKTTNEMAALLEKELKALNVEFLMDRESNQMFPIFDNKVIDKIGREILFEMWEKGKDKSVIRFVTNYQTTSQSIDDAISVIKKAL